MVCSFLLISYLWLGVWWTWAGGFNIVMCKMVNVVSRSPCILSLFLSRHNSSRTRLDFLCFHYLASVGPQICCIPSLQAPELMWVSLPAMLSRVWQVTISASNPPCNVTLHPPTSLPQRPRCPGFLRPGQLCFRLHDTPTTDFSNTYCNSNFCVMILLLSISVTEQSLRRAGDGAGFAPCATCGRRTASCCMMKWMCAHQQKVQKLNMC